MSHTAKTTDAPLKVVTCPSCGVNTPYTSANPFRPFCSARCKNADLGAWASESFRMPVSSQSADQGGEEPPDSSLSH